MSQQPLRCLDPAIGMSGRAIANPSGCSPAVGVVRSYAGAVEDRHFDRIELAEVMPDISQDQIDRIRSAAAHLDQPQPPLGRSGWTWFPDKVAGGRESWGRWNLFGTNIVFGRRGSDTVEFDLSVMREEPPRLTVEVSIALDCWCDQDHSMHEIRAQSWLVGSAEPFTEAFESAVTVLSSWIAGGHDASVYRNSADLPGPPDRENLRHD